MVYVSEHDFIRRPFIRASSEGRRAKAKGPSSLSAIHSPKSAIGSQNLALPIKFGIFLLCVNIDL